ncbi:MAG: glycosyltransferase [Candidatus Pedobacter colombiensis]|uniref:Glycosyltransferase n=1 Tax=Candidatus Pedobacter colombiensis TaxID=3121371 RepID=A0AAJ6B7K7_9SPHI|nr:glycosyltransferase [Pedobacter sp.]WEK19606.1 MAG: glycosyltransferase [Pedobacter sp.]
MIKVLHINTYEGNGGAGRACLRLNDALNANGIDSRIMTYFKFKESAVTEVFSKSPFQKAKAIVNILAERYLSKAVTKAVKIPFSLQWFGSSIVNHPLVKDTDIIHLHWINHGFLSPKFIGELGQLNKPIVWTFHDSNPLTGGCHVRYTCQQYLYECGNCPVLKNSNKNDFSHKTWKSKQKAYSKVNFSIISPSTWMGKCASEASLTKNHTGHVISNALDTDFFKPADKGESRRELGIDLGVKVILAGYMPSTDDRHKGLKELQETIQYLCADPGVDKDKLLLLFYGSNGEGIDLNIPIPYKFAGRIDNDDLLIKLYSAADVFLFPSIEESMGYTALESLSCGTPVAGFNTSGVPDVVVHKENGYLAKLYDTKSLAAGVQWILNEADGTALSLQARSWAVSKFSSQVIARQHIELYNKLMS